MKKIVIFGGGSGLSQLLKGIKLFPVDITAVVTVADNGASTGRLRRELNIPAVGDISKVMISMANINQDVKDLMNYRFNKSKSLGNHSIKNLLLTALLDMKGNFADSLPVLEELLDIKGSVLPLTEDNVNLIGYTYANKKIVGEVKISKYARYIKKIEYNKEINVNPKVFDAVKKADLIIFSSGSLITSIIPHLVDKKLNYAIRRSRANKMYICNLFTQPGETDGYKVSDHIKQIEKYLGYNTIDIVIANNENIQSKLMEKYLNEEQKDIVKVDYEKLSKMKVKLIADKLYLIEDGFYRHDSLKTGYLIFSYLMDGQR